MKIEPTRPIRLNGKLVKSGDEVPDDFGQSMINLDYAVKSIELKKPEKPEGGSGKNGPARTADKKPSETRENGSEK